MRDNFNIETLEDFQSLTIGDKIILLVLGVCPMDIWIVELEATNNGGISSKMLVKSIENESAPKDSFYINFYKNKIVDQEFKDLEENVTFIVKRKKELAC